MHYITIPNDAVLENLRNQKTNEPPLLKFVDFVRGTLVQHPRVTESGDTIKYFRQMADSVKGLVPGQIWGLQPEEYELLSSLAKTFQYDPNVKLNVLDLIYAITSAPTRKPETAPNGEADKPAEKAPPQAPPQ